MEYPPLVVTLYQILKIKSNPHYATPNQQSITVAGMIRTERAIVRVAESQVFGNITPVLRNHEGFHDPVKLITEQQLRDNPSVRKLQTLNPYLVDGIIRVGGRLQRSTLSLEEKHPIILPNQHPVTELLVLIYHEREGHMGCSQVLTAMYKQYWILPGSVESEAPFDVFIKADGYRRSWRKTQYLADLFWELWTNQYLPLLQTRHKWFGTVPSLKPGDLVLIVNESTKRGH